MAVRDAFAVDDHVRIGRGQVEWIIVGFDHWPDGREYAELKSVEGYANTTATIDRLKIVSRGGES